MSGETAFGASGEIENDEGERLQKVLARVGWGSRRECEILIEDGRVRVNGEIAILGRRVKTQTDKVEVDGIAIGVAPGLVYYLLNKPVDVITTAKDTHGRQTVIELVPFEPRVFPVGRLDADTEGLLILTNDGELGHRLTHPSFGIEKEYLAHVQCGQNGVEAGPITGSAADTAVHHQTLRIFCHIRIQIVLDHAERGFGQPGFAGQRAAFWRTDDAAGIETGIGHGGNSKGLSTV